MAVSCAAAMIRAHLVLAWLTAWLLVAAAKPPRACSNLGKGTVDCAFRDLVTFPCPLPNDTQILWLNNNKLRSIPAAALQYLQNLTTLHLQNNLLTHVEQSTFDALPNLQQLIAYNNPWDCSCNKIGPLSQWLHGKTLSGGTIGCKEDKSRAVKDVAWVKLPNCVSPQGNVTQAPPFVCRAPPTEPHPPTKRPVWPSDAPRNLASSVAIGRSWALAVPTLVVWAALLAALSV